MVISYSMCMNLVEVPWEAMMNQVYPTKVEYLDAAVNIQLYTATTALFVTLYIAAPVFRNSSWLFGALLSPIIIGGMSITFLTLAIFKGSLIYVLPRTVTPIVFLAFFGTIHNIIGKTMKYSFFDPSKEMAYIPLDQTTRNKSKAAIDLLGSRFGKTGSSWIQTALIQVNTYKNIGQNASILSSLPFFYFHL